MKFQKRVCRVCILRIYTVCVNTLFLRVIMPTEYAMFTVYNRLAHSSQGHKQEFNAISCNTV